MGDVLTEAVRAFQVLLWLQSFDSNTTMKEQW